MAVENEIQSELKEFEVSDEDYLECANRYVLTNFVGIRMIFKMYSPYTVLKNMIAITLVKQKEYFWLFTYFI